jgi:predicted amidohydrolase
MHLTLSLAQFNIKNGDFAANLATVQTMAAEAARRGSGILLLPELWATGGDFAGGMAYVQNERAMVHEAVADLARQHNLHIIGSDLALNGAGKMTNTAVFYNNHGQSIANYDKIHLFQLMGEHHHLSGGDHLALVDTDWGKMGLSICYDLRFPELFRAYALAGAQLVLLPAEWPHPRLAHWRTLLRARAIENQMYIVACNRTGRDEQYHFFGHSTIIDPWGDIVVEAGEGELLLTATVDMDVVTAVRQHIPIFADRRPELYATWT